jgi:hypothetical protein
MFCPGCAIQVTDDTKFCKNCGANLRGVREAMLSRAEKFDWSRTWVAEMLLSQEEQERRRGVTPEKKYHDTMKAGVITTFVGLGAMIFFYYFLIPVANAESGNDAEIIRRVWLVGVVPFLIGIAILFNGLVFGRREIKLEEERRRSLPQPTQGPAQIEAAPTNDLLISPQYGVTEDTTAHLPDSVNPPSRQERN